VALPEYKIGMAQQALPKENIAPEKKQAVPKREKSAENKYSKIERLTIYLTALLGVVVLLMSLATQVALSNQNRALQDLQNDSVAIGLENQNLEQEVQELSRYDRIIAIAKELGLEMNEANVRNVTR